MCFFQGRENETKIFVCTSKSQLIANSDVDNTLNVTAAKVDLVIYIKLI